MEADLDAADGNNFFSQSDVGFRQIVVARRVDPVGQMDDQTFSLGIFLPEHCALCIQYRNGCASGAANDDVGQHAERGGNGRSDGL